MIRFKPLIISVKMNYFWNSLLIIPIVELCMKGRESVYKAEDVLIAISFTDKIRESYLKNVNRINVKR